MVNRITRYAQIMDILSKYGFGIGLETMFPGKARFRLPIPGKDPARIHGIRTYAARP